MDFKEAFDRTIAHEAGYINNPFDPGGETHWGISKRSYPNVDVKNLTRDQAKEIYKRDFWDKLPDIHDSVKFQLFDFAINSGLKRAILKLQLSLGVDADGIIGNETITAINARPAVSVCLGYIAVRLEYLTNLKNWHNASRGWSRRIAKQLLYAMEDCE